MAGPGRNTEELGKRGEADAAQAPFQQAPGEGGGAEGRLGEPPTVQGLQLSLEEPLVEAGVVGGERCVTGERDEASDDARDGGCTAQLLVAKTGQTRYRWRESQTGVDERLERIDELECSHARCSDLADPVACGREPRRLQVEDDELRLLQQRVLLRAGERDGRARTEDAAVSRGDVRKQRTGKTVRDGARGEQQHGRVHRRQSSLFVEHVHQTVEPVERELHCAMKLRTHVRVNRGDDSSR